MPETIAARVKNFIIIFIISVAFSQMSYSQTGGSHTYEFLNLTTPARAAALGGNNAAIPDDDVNFALSNPSLISPLMDNHLAFNFVDGYSDINFGFATYSKTFEKVGSLAASLMFVDYGKFEYADLYGNRDQGTFSVADYALNLGWGRRLNPKFSIGANFKTIYSSYESYTSFGMAVDVAGSYISDEDGFMSSLIVRNMGTQIQSYSGYYTEPLPFEIQIAASKKFTHAPFRVHLLLNELNRWDLRYEDPYDTETDPITGEVIEKNTVPDWGDEILRHVVVGGEFLPSKNFSVRFGYNYKRRQEMKVDSKVSMVGFSWGFGIRISKFHLSYARSTYHLAGSPNFISVSTNLSEFFVKE